jgi:hypothetical protein
MAPVHADVVQRPSCTEGGQFPQSLTEKSGEFGLVHLTRGHREGAVVDRAETARMTVDRHIVRRVGKDHRGALLAHQRGEGPNIEGAAAQKPITAEKPEISDLADRRSRRDLEQHFGRVGILGRCVLERGDPQVDLAHLEAGHFEVEIETAERKVSELLGQQPVVPDRDLGQPVVGDHEGASLGRGQVIEAQCRHLAPSEFAASEQPAIPSDHVIFTIDQDRNIEAEGRDAAGDLPGLLFAMQARVGRIQLQRFYPAIDDRQM